MKHLNWVIPFLLLAILLPGCEDQYGSGSYFDSGQGDIAMAQNLLYESQQLNRERAAIAAEDMQLSADLTAFRQGPERDFLSTLNEQETLAYDKLLSAYVGAANEAEIDAALREIFRTLPKEKAFHFVDVANGIAGLGERLTILLERTEQHNKKVSDFQRRHAIAGEYLRAKAQPQPPYRPQEDGLSDYFQQQELRRQQRDVELYRMNMLNSLSSINSELEQIRQQQQSEDFRRQLDSMDRFK